MLDVSEVLSALQSPCSLYLRRIGKYCHVERYQLCYRHKERCQPVGSVYLDGSALHDLLDRAPDSVRVTLHQQLDALSAPQSCPDTQIMAIVNVTPDSFAGRRSHYDPVCAIAYGLRCLEQGADVVDVGGESTRPGALPVDPLEEIRRIRPVVAGLVRAGAKVSIDTRNTETMRVALGEGASLVNDVSALRHGGDAAVRLVAEAGCPVILMHMLGEPRYMQDGPEYQHVTFDICDFLAHRIALCRQHDITRDNIWIDPGIGFGKTLDDTVALMATLDFLPALGVRVMLGVSRKGFIQHLDGRVTEPKHRIAGSIAAGLAGIACGVRMLRVHDVGETRQAIRVWQSIERRAQAGITVNEPV